MMLVFGGGAVQSLGGLAPQPPLFASMTTVLVFLQNPTAPLSGFCAIYDKRVETLISQALINAAIQHREMISTTFDENLNTSSII